MNRPALALVALLGLGQPACSLFDTDFEGSIRLSFQIDDPDPAYSDIEEFRPSENDDFRNNRDRIKDGRIESMEFRFLRIDQANRASLIGGQANVRQQGGDWVEGVTAWEGIYVNEGNVFFVPVPGDRQAVLSELVFGQEDPVLEIDVNGFADQSPVRFDMQVTLNMVFTAGL